MTLGRSAARDEMTGGLTGDRQGRTAATSDERGPAPVPAFLDRGPRAALAVFVLVEVAAAILFVRAGRDQWFFLDEFDFLATRSLGDPVGLLRPHFDHWVTIPIIPYRVLWSLFGLRSYLPYQTLAVASHLGVAALLRVVMRRAGIGPWLATIGASVVALFGSGSENMVWAFQITFTWALAFGLIHLLLAGHDGAIDRRDWLGLLAGLLGMMCSGPGLVMVGVVGLALLLRRRWRAAIFHAAPLVAIYGVWLLVFGESSEFSERGLPGAGVVARFVWRGSSRTFDALGQLPMSGWLLAVVMVVGIAVGVRSGGARVFAARASGPLALATGAPALLLMTALGRGAYYGADRSGESRYLYLVGAMVVPLAVVACQALVERWRAATPFVLVMLLVGVPGNLAAADDRHPYLLGSRDLILALATVDAVQQVPPEADSFPVPDFTAGWLRDGVAAGSIPRPAARDVRIDAVATMIWVTHQTTGPDTAPPSGCRDLVDPTRVQFSVGQRISFRGGWLNIHDPAIPPPLAGLSFDPANGEVIEFRAPTEVMLESGDRRAPTEVCGLPTE